MGKTSFLVQASFVVGWWRFDPFPWKEGLSWPALPLVPSRYYCTLSIFFLRYKPILWTQTTPFTSQFFAALLNGVNSAMPREKSRTYSTVSPTTAIIRSYMTQNITQNIRNFRSAHLRRHSSTHHSVRIPKTTTWRVINIVMIGPFPKRSSYGTSRSNDPWRFPPIFELLMSAQIVD